MLNGSSNGNSGSLASRTIGGRTYPVVAVPQCRVCSHPLRPEVERLMVEGFGYASIVRQHLPGGHGLTGRNLGDHVKNGHLPIAVESVSRFFGEHAEERAEVASAGADLVEQAFDVVQTVLGRVWTKLKDDALDPGVREGLAAARLALDFHALAQRKVDREEITKGFLAYMAEARAVMTPEQFTEFGRRLARNPSLRSLRDTGSSG